MSLEAFIFTTLQSAALQTLVSNRVYPRGPESPPQGVQAPYIVYQRISGRTWRYLEGGAPSLRHAHVQFDVWAKSHSAALEVAEEVRAALLAQPQCSAMGELASTADDQAALWGFVQDFGIFYSL